MKTVNIPGTRYITHVNYNTCA